uniref:G-protein coupled receptors family 1 profile domain-containing protein n=1 Tax=Onchocerca volvulus TaxID=6282 RepID=A0A8R1TM78_ONCVO
MATRLRKIKIYWNIYLNRVIMVRSYSIIILFLIFPSTSHKKNTTNMFDIRDEHHKTIKYIAVLLFIIFSLYSLTTNLLMAIVLFCRRRDKFYSQSFVLIALQLIISHFLGFIPQLVVVIPEILQTKNSSYANQTTWINNTFSTFNTFAIYAVLHFSFLMTLNRFVKKILAGHGGNAVKTHDYERSLLIQAAIYCGMMEVGFQHFAITFDSNFRRKNRHSIGKEARNIVKKYLLHFLHLRTALSKTKVFIIGARTNTVQ